MKDTEKRALYQLTAIDLGASVIRRMFAYAGSFSEALKISWSEYTAAGIFKSNTLKNNFDTKRNDDRFLSVMSSEFDRLEEKNIRMITFDDKEMPGRFSALEDPPVCVFVKGHLPDDRFPSVSIVGCRTSSQYGTILASEFAKVFADNKIQVVCGLQAGIESAAAHGALLSDHGCYAVLGSGVDVCYPMASKVLYDKMISCGGVVSEYVPGATPTPRHFVENKRLAAALGDVIVVFEAHAKSSETAAIDLAISMGKDVFALPGRVTDPLAAYSNRLIRDGAEIITCPDDVLSYFRIAATV